MIGQGKVLNLPYLMKRDKREIKNLDTFNYFNDKQIKLLRSSVREKAELKGNLTVIKEWIVIDLLTQTGLRVSEVASLRCGDLKIGYGELKIFVREGKGALFGHIVISESLKRHLKQFLSWKEKHSVSIGTDDFLFIGQRVRIPVKLTTHSEVF